MANKKIMVLEDDPAILDVLTLIFYDAGYEVIALRSSQEAELFYSSDLDLIILDFRLVGSDKNGAEICELYKSRTGMQDIPMLILSAERDIEEIARECGADGFVKKPFDINHLITVTERYLKK